MKTGRTELGWAGSGGNLKETAGGGEDKAGSGPGDTGLVLARRSKKVLLVTRKPKGDEKPRSQGERGPGPADRTLELVHLGVLCSFLVQIGSHCVTQAGLKCTKSPPMLGLQV